MRVTLKDGWFVSQYISGPRYAVLAIQIDDKPVVTPTIDASFYGSMHPNEPITTTPDLFMPAVREAESRVRSEYGMSLGVRSIRFDPRSTPASEIYGWLAYDILRYVAENRLKSDI